MKYFRNNLELFKYILVRSIFISFFLIVLFIVIALARGYRFDPRTNTITSTGIISVNSSPKPAKVYVNGVFKGASDLNLTLPYGNYDIEIKKDGYTDWKKKINLKGEIVMSVDGLLFPKNPSLSPLTNLGITKSYPIPETDKVILFSDNGDIEKDGIYLFESDQKTIPIFAPLTLLVLKSNLPQGTDFNTAETVISPEYKEAIITFGKDDSKVSYLFNINEVNTELFDITVSRETILSVWEEEKQEALTKVLETFPKAIRTIAPTAFNIIAFSPDERKILYQAKAEATIAQVIKPPLIGANQTAEERSIKSGKVYVYDKKEDKNFPLNINVDKMIPAQAETEELATPSAILADDTRSKILSFIHWYPNSGQIVFKRDMDIKIMGYDGTNEITVYSGPAEQNFFAITPEWNLLVLANLNPQNNKYPDLYTIGIR